MSGISINWLTIDDETLSDLLTCALEGGSNYWYWIDDVVEPKKWVFSIHENKEEHYYQDYPINEGGALIISDQLDEENKNMRLDRGRLLRGLEVLSTKYPQHLASLLSGDFDAETGDVFLQCCLFEEVLYG